MIRSIRYKITEDTKGIEPKTKQWAGMQYEDNATVVEFDISNLPHAIHSARIDFDSAAAGYHPSVNLQVSNSGIISREIPKYITQYGGDLQIVAVITTEDGLTREADAVCYSYPVTVYFTPVSKSEGGSEDVEGNISEMEKVVKEMAASVESNLQTTDDYRKETELYYREAKGLHDSIIAADVTAEKLTETKQEAEELIDTVEQKLANGDFNGKDGKDGKDGANGKDAITDQSYNPESENAQSGKAVAEAIANAGGGGGSSNYTEILSTELTQEAVDKAGEEGVIVVSVGDKNKTFAPYNEIIIRIDTPDSSALNTGEKPLSVYMNNSETLTGTQSTDRLLFHQNTALKSAILSPTANAIAVDTKWVGDTFLYGHVVKNGVGATAGYPTVPDGWVAINNTALKKSERSYIHIFSRNKDFKFPAGTTVKVYGR